MKKALTALMAIAIVGAGCATGRVSDDAYLTYMEKVAINEMQTCVGILYTIQTSSLFNPMAPCLRVDDLETATEKLTEAWENAPRPSHPSLKEHLACSLQAMEYQLLAIQHLDKGCVNMDADEMYLATINQDAVFRLMKSANWALDEYNKSL